MGTFYKKFELIRVGSYPDSYAPAKITTTLNAITHTHTEDASTCQYRKQTVMNKRDL